MKRVALFLSLSLAACQWVLPIHEGDALPSDAAAAAGHDGAVAAEAAPSADAPAGDANASPPDAATVAEGGSTPPCTSKTTYVKACDDCLNTKCCAEVTACFVTNRAQCVGLGNCIAGCGFDFVVCPPNCIRTFEAGVDDLDRFNRCTQGSCGAECSRDAGDG